MYPYSAGSKRNPCCRTSPSGNSLTQPLCIVLYCILLYPITACFASASPALPEYGVNHTTKECSMFFMGDECVACRMPEGWESLGAGYKDLCPEGYKKVELNPQCSPSKNPFCCTKGHSGAPGSCKDIVIHEKGKKCAFVEDIEKCATLPEGWQRPKGETVCPSLSYGWQNTLLPCPGEYAPPLVNGMRVDWCLTWGADCGQAAADRFCRMQGYAKAESWRWEHVEPTLVLGDGNRCSGKGRCGGFAFIRCTEGYK